jgi:hypothetical protein
VRDHDTKLTEAEVRTLATVIALSGGMFLLSDDMTRLNPERQRYIAPLLPMLGVSARALGWLNAMMPDVFVLPLSGPTGKWLVAGIFNWEAAARTRTVEVRAESLGLDPGAAHFVSDFWEGEHWALEPGQPMTFNTIPPHGVRLVALRPKVAAPTLVSSSLHFSQGGEVHAWEVSTDSLRLGIELGRVAEGWLRLALPEPPRAALLDAHPITLRDLGRNIYHFSFSVNRTATLEVRW